MLYARRLSLWGRRWLTAVLVMYWFLSTPFGSWLISAPISGYGQIQTREQAKGAQAVVMLGGGIITHVVGVTGLDDLGTSAYRAIETARVYKLLGDPLVIVSGGNTSKDIPPRPEAAAYKEAVATLGVPRDRIILEDQSLNTREEAVIIKRMMAERHIDRFVIVTAPTHMGRALGVFRHVGLDPVPSVAPMRGDDDDTPFWTPMPDRESLFISDTAIYDYAAIAYYWMTGWFS